MQLFLSAAKSVEIIDYKNLRKYTSYCEASYAVPKAKPSMKLEKLFIFHRHGDRSSLEIEGTNWDTKICKSCKLSKRSIADCTDKKCDAGMLTSKGYNQMLKLGRFISANYSEEILRKMYKRATSIPRTQASIHGVLNGMFPEKPVNDVIIKELENDRLMIPKGCPYINSKITNKGFDNLAGLFKEGDALETSINDPKRRADLYLTAMCNNIEIFCDVISCEPKKIEDYIKGMSDQWNEQTNILAHDEEILGLTFGVFANELLEYINDSQHTSYVFSVHDKSISMLGVGFGMQIYDHPPYAAVIILEVHAKGDQRFIRLIYNDRVQKTTLDDSTYIPYDKFISYLDMIKKSEAEYEKACTNGIFINIEKPKVKDGSIPLDSKSI